MRNCPVCGAKMVPLFFSLACSNSECGSLPSDHDGLYHGYIVWRSRPPGSCEYVFKTIKDAKSWRSAAGLNQFDIVLVASVKPFNWRKSTGSVPDIELADRLYEVFPGPEKKTGTSQVWRVPV